MSTQKVIDWLLKGDVSIQYQVHRDLLGVERDDLQRRIAEEGWGKLLMSARNPNGHWGLRFYQPKWTSTHYTLLDLRNLNLNPDNSIAQETIEQTLVSGKAGDGGICLGPSTRELSDVCVNGMFLNYASYFRTEEKALHSVVDAILQVVMPDGGFNCQKVRSGASHSSLHSTISVLEGLHGFQSSGYVYRSEEMRIAIENALDFILRHQLFLSDRTGEIIHRDFLKMPYPCRWRYDILRALDYFQYAGLDLDGRMKPAMEVIMQKRNNNGTWNLNAPHPGKVHFVMEEAGKPSRWNTLRAMRVLSQFHYLIL